MIHSNKDSRSESLFRKIRNSAKEINEAVEKLEKLLEKQPEIERCDGCKHRSGSDRLWICQKCKRQYEDKYEAEKKESL